MTALEHLRRAGLTVEAAAGKLRVSPVERITPEIYRFIVEHKDELLEELAGIRAAPAISMAPSSAWLARVARLLDTRPAGLLEGGHLEQHDLLELAGTDASQVAETIRTSPAWINRPQRIEQQLERVTGEEGEQPIIETATTAAARWREARDRYHNHIFPCPACHAPTDRYCQTGAELRATYNATSWS